MPTRLPRRPALAAFATIIGLAATLPADDADACSAHYEPPPAAEPASKGEAPAASVHGEVDADAPGADADARPWRWRASAGVSVVETRFGRPLERSLQITDRRLAFGAGFATADGWHAEVEAPVVQRTASFDSGRSERSTSIGDVALGAGRWWHRRRVTVGAHGGLVAPTAPTTRDADGVAVSDDAQPGGGAWAPWLGGGLRGAAGPLDWRADTVVFVPARSRFDLRTGASFDVITGATWGFGEVVRLDAAVSARVAEADRFDDGDDPDSGGTLVQLAPSITARPWRHLEVTVGARIPVVDALRGHQWVGPRWLAGVSFDG